MLTLTKALGSSLQIHRLLQEVTLDPGLYTFLKG